MTGSLRKVGDGAVVPSATATIVSLETEAPKRAAPDMRIAALRRFAAAITILTVLGHVLLGFEQSWAHVLVALAATYGLEIGIELVDAWSNRRPVRLLDGFVGFVDFLLPAHITGLAIAMLLYPGERLAPILFAAFVAIGSKRILRVQLAQSKRHFFNPSNIGIVATLIFFPSVGIAPPYQFTEYVSGAWDWIIPIIIVCTGTFLNARFTRRLPLIAAWLSVFAAQAMLRSLIFDASLIAAFGPMTGMAFVLFTFYMVPDPGTTPRTPRGQVAFGVSVATVYGFLMVAHVVFGLFFALMIVCAVRGVALYIYTARADAERASHSSSNIGEVGA